MKKVLLRTAESYFRAVAGLSIGGAATGQVSGPDTLGPLFQTLLWGFTWALAPAIIAFAQYMGLWINDLLKESGDAG